MFKERVVKVVLSKSEQLPCFKFCKFTNNKTNFRRPEEFKDLIKQKYKIGIEKDSYYHAGQQKVAKCERDLLSEGDCNFESEEDSDDDIPANPNHVQEYDESEESSSEEEED